MNEINDYKPNSHRYKEEQKNKETEKKIEKVVTGKVITKKKNGFTKLASEIISEDAKNVKSYIIGDVLIPAMKKAISDIVTNGIDMILYGGSRPGKRSTADRISYSGYYGGSTSSREPRTVSTYNGYSFDDIILATRGEAQDVLDRMDEVIESFGVVSVADLYDLVGITGRYTDNKYGWTNLRDAEVIRVRDGYMIKMPRAKVLD
jgi:hypothetical protein